MSEVNKTTLVEAIPSGYELVPPIVATLVEQTNSYTRSNEIALHSAIAPLIAEINVLDAEAASIAQEAIDQENIWKADERTTHLGFVSKPMFFSLAGLTVIGEAVLAAVTLKGLRLDDLEVYISAAAVVCVGMLICKGIAQALRYIPFEKDALRKKFLWVMLGAAVTSVVAMLGGMWVARDAYAVASGMAAESMLGVGLLQIGLYLAQTAAFYFLMPANPVADQARRNFKRARKEILSIVVKRAKLSAKLNQAVSSYRAKCEEEIANGKRLLLDYIRRLHAEGKSKLLEPFKGLSIKSEWFYPVAADRVALPADAPPRIVQEVIQGTQGGQPLLAA